MAVKRNQKGQDKHYLVPQQIAAWKASTHTITVTPEQPSIQGGSIVATA